MRIAIDARELIGRPTGVGRYLAALLDAWSQLPAAGRHEFLLCAPHPVDLDLGPFLRAATVTAPGNGTLWEQLALPALIRAGADVLFAPAYTAPVMSRVPLVVAIHDVSFAAHPEWFSRQEGVRRRVLTRLSGRRAARILTVSEFSKREIVARLGVDAAKVEVVYHGVPAVGPRGQSAAAGRWRGSSDPGGQDAHRVLYVGSLFNRRRIPEMIDGFARLARRRPQVRFDIVGENRTNPRLDVAALVARSGAADRIRVHDYLTDDALASLYAAASAFIFLSEYEGFGFTPLEALSAGVPIVVLDTDVSREIYGPAALYVGRPEPALIEAALESALFDPGERSRVTSAAATVLQRYSWEECARRTLQVLLACGRQTGSSHPVQS